MSAFSFQSICDTCNQIINVSTEVVVDFKGNSENVYHYCEDCFLYEYGKYCWEHDRLEYCGDNKLPKRIDGPPSATRCSDTEYY